MANILLVDDLGGHGKQMEIIRDGLGEEHTILSVKPESKSRSLESEEEYEVRRPANPEDNKITKIHNSLLCSFQMLKMFLFGISADVVITAGAGIGAIAGYIGKITGGSKVIFIESWSRVESKSGTGKLLQWIADLIFVQHLELVDEYDDAEYAGRLR